MAAGENEIEVGKFLRQFKQILPKKPILATLDYAPALEASVKAEFPEILIQHDYFHTAKSLNRALRKEIMRLQRTNYNNPIKKYKQARKLSISLEKSKKMPDKIHFNISYLDEGWTVLEQFIPLLKISDLKQFQTMWNSIISKILLKKWKDTCDFYSQIKTKIPLCGITDKNMRNILSHVFKIWRKLIRHERHKYETPKKDFVKAKYVVLQNPVKMSKKDNLLLRKFLGLFPWMRPIRKVVRKFHYQFKAPESARRSLKFMQNIVQPESHKELKSVINTFIEKEEQIFAYRKIWAQYSHLDGDVGIRSNHEEINRKVNLVARNQYGFRNLQNIRLRLEHALKCPIIISEALL